MGECYGVMWDGDTVPVGEKVVKYECMQAEDRLLWHNTSACELEKECCFATQVQLSK